MKILFMCVANSARSQLAEALAKNLFKDQCEIMSAGSQPTKVNPFAIRVLAEAGIDHRGLYSKSVDDLPKTFLDDLTYIVTLCAEEVCPILLSRSAKLHWPLSDPAGKEGTDEEQMARFRATCNQIMIRLQALATDLGLDRLEE